MNVFHYDSMTREFTATSEAYENPRREGSYIVPQFATLEKPPVLNNNQVAIFDGKKWNTISDYRGSIVFDIDGNSSVVDYLGSIKKGFSLEPPIIEEATSEIEAENDNTPDPA